jgi:hypothetical protein
MSIDAERDARLEAPAAAWIGYLGWVVLLFALGRVLVAASQLSLLAGPVSDDLARAGAARDPGIWEYSVMLYTGWSGRWAGVGMALILGRLFDLCAAYPWLLAILNLTMPLAIYNMLSAAFEDRLARGTRVALTIGFVALHWGGDPCLSDSYYWVTGALENHLSLSMGLVIIAGLIRAGRRVPSWIGFAGMATLAIVMPGMHELYGIYLVGVLAVGTVVAYWTGSPGRHVWAAITAVALAGLAINLGSPGHAKRLGFNAPRHDLERFHEVTRQWRHMVLGWVTDFKLLLASLLIVCHPRAAAACPDWLRARRGWCGALGAAFTLAVVVSAAIVNWWTFATFMPGRTQSAIYFLFLVGWFVTVYAMGTVPFLSAPVSRPVWAALAGCFALAVLAGTNYQYARDDLASGRAARLHQAVRERDRLLREAVAAGDRNPTVPAYPPMPLCLLSADIVEDPDTHPAGWINLIFCKFYGLDSIHPRPDNPATAAAPGEPIRR